MLTLPDVIISCSAMANKLPESKVQHCMMKFKFVLRLLQNDSAVEIGKSTGQGKIVREKKKRKKKTKQKGKEVGYQVV